MAAKKTRRRGAGQGGVSRYQAKTLAAVIDVDGEAVLDRDGNPRMTRDRWLIKWIGTDTETGTDKTFLRRRGRATGRQPNMPFTSEAAAIAELDDIRNEIRNHTYVSPRRTTLGGYLDEWLAGLQLEQSTHASYAKNIRLHIKPALGDKQIQSLTGAQISKMYRAMETSGRRDHRAGEGLSPRTVRYCHTILKSALGDAVKQGIIATNPADHAKPPSARAAKAPEIHPWAADELSTFLAWCRRTNAPHTVAYHVLSYCGMRRGECLELRWRDLDIDNARLSIRRSVGVVKEKGNGQRLVVGPTKSGKPRVIDLDADTVEILRKWRLERAKLSLELVADDALIFGRIEGGHHHPERFSDRFTAKVSQCRRQLSAEATEVVPAAIHLHDLRHTHATLLLKAGVPVKVVSERLGHATVMITLETYAHVMPGMQSEAAARFAAIVSGGAS